MKKLNALIALAILLNSVAKAQVTTLGNTGANTDFVGWISTQAFPVRIEHQGSQPINFSTAGTQRMTITSAGSVGIGTATPGNLLEISGGDINISTTTSGYKIGNSYVLWHNGLTQNIYVGVGAGSGTATGTQNTFVGNNAGIATTTGGKNTFVGNTAGNTNATGTFNSYFGYKAGASSTGSNNVFLGAQAGQVSTGGSNVFVGLNAGFVNTTGNQNTFFGTTSGSVNTTGFNNTFMGDQSGSGNTTGRNNVFVGNGGGITNVTGNDNTIIGAGADVGFSGLINSTAIGRQAVVTANDKLILGNNQVFVGIGLSNDLTASLGPKNCLEISAHSLGSSVATPNASGLRFRQLTSASPTVANPGLGVLGLSAAGDVIYVPIVGGHGNYCGAASNPLSGDYEIPLSTHNYYFTDPAGTLLDQQNFVKIGDNCGATINAKLEVHRGTTTNSQFKVSGSYTLNDDVAQSTIISGYGFGASGEATGNNRVNSGIYGTSNGGTTNNGGYFEARTAYVSSSVNKNNYGISAYAENAQDDIAVVAQADGSGDTHTGGYFIANNATATNTGVNAISNGSAKNNYGGKFSISGGADTSTAIYARVPGTGVVEYAAHFEGDILFNGTLYGTNNITVSDSTFKTNIDSIKDALSIIRKLNPKQYYFDTKNNAGMRFTEQKQYGLISQQVQRVLPELVYMVTKPAEYDSKGNMVHPPSTYKALNYNAFIAILMKGIQEQQKKIDKLESTSSAQDSVNKSLQDQLNTMAHTINSGGQSQSNASNNTTGINVDLKDTQSIVLEQNVPNPFAEQTIINYFLPENVIKAQVLFYNSQGKLIQSVELTQKGKGQLNVFASDLTTGIYTYTLVADGKIIETKKMIKQ